MKKLVLILACTMLVPALAKAQASGSFNYSGAGQSPTACVLNNDNTGTITGGATCSLSTGGSSCTTATDCSTGQFCFNPTGNTMAGVCEESSSGASCTNNMGCTAPETCVIPTGSNSGTCGVVCSGKTCGAGKGCIGSVVTTIKTSSGNGNVFIIRPSAVVGLLTDVSVTKDSTGATIGTSSAYAGVDFQVGITPGSGNQGTVQLFPSASQPITYDARFIQISTNLFNALTQSCVTTSTTAGAGCFITFNESTVSAHSFDWVASNLSSGYYTLAAQWTSSLGDFGIANSMTCVGPVNLTVEQGKVYNPNQFKPSTVTF